MATEMPLDQRTSPSRFEQSLTAPKASFRALPLELRLMIWEAACIPFATKDGVPYIDIDKVEEDSESGGSLYTRDMGLWNACKESRDVIAAHYHLDLWRLAQTEPFDSNEMQHAIQATHEMNTRPVVSSDNDFFTVILGPLEKDWKTTYHRLCIRTSSPATLMARIRKLNLYLPKVKVKAPKEITLVKKWDLAFQQASTFDLVAMETWQALRADNSQVFLNARDGTTGRHHLILTDRSRFESFDLPRGYFAIRAFVATRRLRRMIRRRTYNDIVTLPIAWDLRQYTVRTYNDIAALSIAWDLRQDTLLKVCQVREIWRAGMLHNWLWLHEDNRQDDDTWTLRQGLEWWPRRVVSETIAR